MSYQIIPNIIFILSVLGILLIVLRHLSEAKTIPEIPAGEPNVHKKLLAKGLPAEAFTKIGTFIKFRLAKIWHFVLEAKDLKPHATSGYKIKKLFSHKITGFKKPVSPPPVTTHEVKNEKYYLDIIKLQPKNLSNYDALGKYYLDRDSLSDAKDIYLYLANHEPSNPEYQARLAYCFYKNKQYTEAASHYQKSLALDSTQPNRYYNLGLSLEAVGNWQEAVKSFEQAITLEPSNIKYFISLGNAYAKAGNLPKSKEMFIEAQKLDPQNELVKSKLARFI